MFNSLTLANLPEIQIAILREATSTRPVIWVVEEDGKKAIVKDFSVNGFFYRNLVGRFLIRRESSIYNQLSGIPGVPACYRTINGLAIVIEKIEGTDADILQKRIWKMEREGEAPESIEVEKAKFSRQFFEAFEKLVKAIHARGIVHCDLKRTPNILVSDEGLPYLVDWASAFSKSTPFIPLRFLYNRFVKDDCLAVMKLKAHSRPEWCTKEDWASFKNKGPVERFVRAIRDRLRNILQKMA